MLFKISWVMHEYMHNRGGLRRPGRGLININDQKPFTFKTVTASRTGDVAAIDAARASSIKHLASQIQTGATFTRTQSEPRSELH